MSNFLFDWLSLLAGKVDRTAPTGPATQRVTAAEYNALVAAVNDLRAECWDGGVNVRSLGADTSGTTDASVAINAALEQMRTGARRGRVYLPPGRYRLSHPIVIEAACVLQGSGGMWSESSTVLLPDPGVTAIVLAMGTTATHTGGDASWCSVRDLYIKGPEAYHQWDGPAANGISVHANGIDVRNVVIFGMQTHGIEISSSPGGTNANCCKIDGVTVYYCGGDGLYFHGADSNAGMTSGCSATGCGGAGLHDGSFLGNTHIRFHTEANDGHAFLVEGAVNMSVLLGCYSESDQVSEVGQSAMVIGGDHGAPISGAGIIDVGVFRNKVISATQRNTSPGVGTFQGFAQPYDAISAAGDAVPGSYQEWRHSTLGILSTVAYGATYHQGFWSTRHDSDPRRTYAMWGANRSVWVPELEEDRLNYRAVPPGTLVLPQGLLVDRLRLSAQAVCPTSGSWMRGDVVRNSLPIAGGPEGWICSESGTFGTYTEGCTGETLDNWAHVVLSTASAVLGPGDWVSVGGVPVQLLAVAPWTPSTVIAADVMTPRVYREASGNLYRLTTNGTSGTVAPSGTSASEADGTCVWAYVGPASRSFWVSGLTGFPVLPTAAGQAIAYHAPVFRPFGAVLPTAIAAGDALRWSGTAWVASPERAAVTQADTAIAIPAGAGERVTLELTSTADITFSATPLIAARPAGSEVTLVNVGTHTLTLTDDGTLAGSKVILASGTTLALAPGGMVRLLAAVDGTHNEILRFA